MKKILLPLLGTVLFFAACGDENTTVVATSDAEKVKAFKDLDDCDSAIVGKLVYVKDSVKAFICTDDGWAAMSGAVVENGSDGSDGKAGKDGKNGNDGKDGSSCTVKAIKGGYKVLCGGDSVGVLMNGAKGDSGAQGIQGEAGESAFELSGFEGTLETQEPISPEEDDPDDVASSEDESAETARRKNVVSGKYSRSVTSTSNSVKIDQKIEGVASYVSTVSGRDGRLSIETEMWYADAEFAKNFCENWKEEAEHWNGSMTVTCSSNTIKTSEYDEGSLSGHQKEFEELCDDGKEEYESGEYDEYI